LIVAITFTIINQIRFAIKRIYFFIFFISLSLSAQNDTILKGKIISESSNLEDIHVVNRSQKKVTTSLQGGYFTLKAKINDTIIFSAVNLKAVQYIVKKEDFGEDLLFVKMEALETTLNEVILTEYKSINPVSLGIIPANQKTFTPAERKLYTATGGGNTYGLNTSVSLDGIINGISGRTKMLKKEVQVEKKEFLLESLRLDFSNNYFIEKLKIPEDYISGFLYYLVENRNFVSIYIKNNKTATEFVLTELSVQYLKLLPNDCNQKEIHEESISLPNEK
jgi:hypothetical protein